MKEAMTGRGVRTIAIAVVSTAGAWGAGPSAALGQTEPGATDRTAVLERFREDVVRALLDTPLEDDRLQEIEGSVAALQELRAARERGETPDLVAANRALRTLKEIARSDSLRDEDRQRLREDVEALLGLAGTEERDAGEQLRADLLRAVVRGDLSDAEAEALQESMETLRATRDARESGRRLRLADARAARGAVRTIRDLMESDAVRSEDGQAVLADLDRISEERRAGRR
jgi:hypothetical protein